ncbi:MAG: DUF4340 domain-containing protein [Phycisphaerales bacterium]
MNPMARTGAFICVAALLVAAALLTRPAPPSTDRLNEIGEPFYPEFTDPEAAASLEVFVYDADAGQVRPFRVELAGGRWTIPSHHGYPADGAERLAQTAASVIDLRRDALRSERAQDHEALGVIDPLDNESPALSGRGDRIILKDAAGRTLADYIVGPPLPDRDGLRAVRIPGRSRTYGVQGTFDISARFRDWVDTALLDIAPEDIQSVTLNDYSIEETTGQVEFVGSASVSRTTAAAPWTIEPAPSAGDVVDAARVQAMLDALAGLEITGVRPKPAALIEGLRTGELRLGVQEQASLQSKGYFLSSGRGLLSNEGEVTLGTADGVRFALRFGEVLTGSGLEVSAGVAAADEADEADADASSAGDDSGTEDGDDPTAPRAITVDDGSLNRYLFITAEFDPSLLGPRPEVDAAAGNVSNASDDGGEAGVAGNEAEPGAAVRAAAEAWDRQRARGEAEAARLNARFADWYYVISAEDFSTVRPALDELTGPPPAPDSAGAGTPRAGGPVPAFPSPPSGIPGG